SLSAFFNNTTQPVRDGNIKDTPPIVVVPTAADRPRWDALQGEIAALRGKIDARKRKAEPEFAQWLAGVKPDDLKVYVPQEGLVLRAPLNEGQGKKISLVTNGSESQISREEAIKWLPGRDAKQKAVSLQTTPAIELPDVGDFEAD